MTGFGPLLPAAGCPVLVIAGFPNSDDQMSASDPLPLKEGGHHFRQSFLHVDHGAVLVEGENLDLASEPFDRFHPYSLVPSAIAVRVEGGGYSIWPANHKNK